MGILEWETKADQEAAKPKCQRCNAVLNIMDDELVEKLNLPYDDALSIRMCDACQTICAHVEGIEDLWRDAKAGPAAIELIIGDARDGLRLKRWLDDDTGAVRLGSNGGMW